MPGIESFGEAGSFGKTEAREQSEHEARAKYVLKNLGLSIEDYRLKY